MHTIQLKPFYHRNAGQIGIVYKLNKETDLIVRRIKGIKWSQTYKCWYVPLQNTDLMELQKLLQQNATVDDSF